MMRTRDPAGGRGAARGSQWAWLAFGMVIALLVAATAAGAQVPVPELLSPAEGAILDNGRLDRQDFIVWDFDWSDCEGATQYQLYVKGVNAQNPIIDGAVQESSYHYVSHGGYIAGANLLDWAWKVRAQVDGVWGDWSPERTFDVEPVDTDPPTAFWDVSGDRWAYAEINACAAAGIVTGYPSGAYQPDLEVTRAQMAVYISRALAGGDGSVQVPTGVTEPTFGDVDEGHWAYRYVEYCAGADIVQGYPGGAYHPDETVNRGQMAVYIARAIATPTGEAGVPDPPPGTEPTFPDVTGENDWAWCYKHVEFIANLGIVQGYWDNTYRPASPVTRDQMAVYVARAFELPM